MTRTLTSIEAAAFLNKHVVTTNQLARDRVIPAAKVGRAWRFMEEDLIAYIRGQYPAPVKPCLSTSSPVPQTGTRISPSPASLGYVDRLAKRIESKRNASTTNGKRSCGN